MNSTPDVLIVGSGVIGLSTAYLLAKQGLQVSVLERGEPAKEASWAGAGIIPPGNLAHTSHPMDRLRAHSSDLIRQWANELEEFIESKTGYRRCGGLELFDETPTDLEALWGGEQILFEKLSPAQTRELCPPLVPARVNYHFPTMAQIRNPWYLKALLTAVEKLGVQILSNQEVVRFETGASRITAAISQDGSRHPASKFLLCPGAWGGRLLALLEINLPVRPVRGQIVVFRTKPDLLPKIVSVGPNYFVPRADGRLLVGATEDPEAAFDKSTKIADARMLTEFAIQHVPVLKNAPIEHTWAGLRPGSPGGIPFIGPVPGFANAFFAGGHYRAGIQLSPGTALAMSELLTDSPPWLDLAPFRLDRTSAEPHLRPFQS
ncbi:NAD(P)/FAD-dependent oxidoreductase [Zavarzinella formosa]|uniref:NAD(P)/FAD-dependent oxidoreductase n=1 Tax=Zavarzinella formosa TaxID=360055 RepID=UPI0002E45480|nr:FAD-dependent oxidoreductase [Zavarzinella formosa]